MSWAGYRTKTRELSRTVHCGCPDETCCIFASFADFHLHSFQHRSSKWAQQFWCLTHQRFTQDLLS